MIPPIGAFLGQEQSLAGVDLCWRAYRQNPTNPDWDHDDCAFCWADFCLKDHDGARHEGYCTLDDYHWICRSCFDDFKELFSWRVVAPD